MKLRCGVVGLGRGKHFVKVLSAIEDCEVVAVCDPNPAAFQGLSGLATYTNYDQFLDEKLDVVAVISPGPAHARQSLEALDRGAHVLCETPCVYSLDEAKAVVAAVRRTGLKYMLAENYIWAGWCVNFKKMVDAGKFGEILYAEGDYTHDCRDIMFADQRGFVPYADRDSHPEAKPTWRATDLPPIQYCSHTLGPILHLLGDRTITAYGLSVMSRSIPGVVPTDIEAALFQTTKGTMIRLTNGFSVAHPYALYYNFVGTRGSAKLLSAAGLTTKWWTEVGQRSAGWQELTPQQTTRPDGRPEVEVMVEQFIESIRKDTKPPLDIYESMDMTVPGIIAHQSGIQGGVKLPVPDLRR